MNECVFDIYETARKNSWRFLLGKSGLKPLVVVGLNPSTATDIQPDMTIRKIQRIATDNGYDSFVVANLYPVRSTVIEELPEKPSREAYRQNFDVIESLVARLENPCVWAAWSQGVLVRDYLQQARDDLILRLAKHPVTWLRYGPLTKSGHPRHPSRVPYGLAFEPYEA
jgi:hypothetical protein